MTKHRFFISPQDIAGQKVNISDSQIVQQINKVLRLQEGADIVVLDNSGKEYTMVIEQKTKKNVLGKITETHDNKNMPSTELTLYQSLLKKDNFEWVLAKGTEIGVTKFVPLIAERSVKVTDKIPERWIRIVKEAAEVCERGKLPEIMPITTFSSALKHVKGGKNIIASERDGQALSQVKQSIKSVSAINFFIGPEGGFSEKKFTKNKNNGMIPLHLDNVIIRAETAAVVISRLLLF